MEMRETNGWELRDISPVELIDTMGDDDAVCDAARVSFDKEARGFTADQNARLLKYLAKHRHWSPFAHVHAKFRFHAPIFIARQFVKHQIGFAWNEVSRRYVDNDPWYFVPHSWRKRPENMKQGSITEGETVLTNESVELGRYLVQAREWHRDYRSLRLSGVCPEQARMVQPQSMMTEWIWTGSLEAWARFYKLRIDKHAQAECWPYARDVSVFLKDAFPASWEALTGESE